MGRLVAAYGLALLAVASAVAARLLLDPFFGDRFPLITLFIAVVLIGGNSRFRGPAILAMVVGGVAGWFFLLQPRNHFQPKSEYYIALSLYAIGCVVMIQVLQALRGAKLRAEARQRELEQEVVARRQAERVLEDADRHKNEFLATLAHELRNPLAAIGNSLELVKHAAGDVDLTRQAHGVVERQLRHLVRLVDDLMDVSRITRNQLRLQQSRVNLTKVIQEAVEMCRPFSQSRRHEVVPRGLAAPLYVNGDVVRLAQVFGNLLHNACKYTEPGGRIELTADVREGHAVMHVSDNGIGIAPELLPKVFQMFTQVDATGEHADGGLGIGLSLVKRLVELHGGTIAARSEGVGRGCDFTITLPLHPDQTPEVAASGGGPNRDAAARRILVVDDNEDSADSLAALLRLSGNEVIVANDGEEAVLKATAHKPDVIMLDIGLPVMNGYEVCRRIRAERWGAGMTIVALTGWGQAEDRRKSTEAGFDLHLVKPLEYDALLRILGGRRGDGVTG